MLPHFTKFFWGMNPFNYAVIKSYNIASNEDQKNLSQRSSSFHVGQKKEILKPRKNSIMDQREKFGRRNSKKREKFSRRDRKEENEMKIKNFSPTKKRREKVPRGKNFRTPERNRTVKSTDYSRKNSVSSDCSPSERKRKSGQSKSLPSLFNFSNSAKKTMVEEFSIAVNIFQVSPKKHTLKKMKNEMRKACEFGRDLVVENKKLRDKMKYVKNDNEKKIRMVEYEKEEAENVVSELKYEMNENKIRLTEIEEEANTLRTENENYRIDFERLLRKNKELRNKIFDIKNKQVNTKKKLSTVKSKERFLLQTKSKLKKKLNSVESSQKGLLKEKEALSMKLRSSEVKQEKLLMEKKILSRRLSETDCTNLLTCMSKRRENVSNFDPDFPPVNSKELRASRSAKNLKKYVLLKNQIKTSFEISKTRRHKFFQNKYNIKRLKVIFSLIKEDFRKLTESFTEFNEKIYKSIKSLTELTEIDNAKEVMKRGNGKDVMNYAEIQNKVIQELGLLNFYHNPKVLHTQKEGVLYVKQLFKWKKCFAVVTQRQNTLTLLNFDDREKVVSRSTLHGAMVREINLVQFEVIGWNFHVGLKAEEEVKKREWIGFLRNLIVRNIECDVEGE